MGQLYASAVGTTVCQIKEIPPRPADFDGKLCLFAPAKGVDEGMIRTAFGGFGEIVAVVDRRLPPMERDEMAVHFTSHQAVLDAINSQLSARVMRSYGAFVHGMAQVQQLESDLVLTAILCRSARRHLGKVQGGFVHGGLRLLNRLRRRRVHNNRCRLRRRRGVALRGRRRRRGLGVRVAARQSRLRGLHPR